MNFYRLNHKIMSVPVSSSREPNRPRSDRELAIMTNTSWTANVTRSLILEKIKIATPVIYASNYACPLYCMQAVLVKMTDVEFNSLMNYKYTKYVAPKEFSKYTFTKSVTKLLPYLDISFTAYYALHYLKRWRMAISTDVSEHLVLYVAHIQVMLHCMTKPFITWEDMIMPLFHEPCRRSQINELNTEQDVLYWQLDVIRSLKIISTWINKVRYINKNNNYLATQLLKIFNIDILADDVNKAIVYNYLTATLDEINQRTEFTRIIDVHGKGGRVIADHVYFYMINNKIIARSTVRNRPSTVQISPVDDDDDVDDDVNVDDTDDNVDDNVDESNDYGVRNLRDTSVPNRVQFTEFYDPYD